jgi:hypothetical protein
MIARTTRVTGWMLCSVLALIALAAPCLAQTPAPSAMGAGTDAVAATPEEIHGLLPDRSDSEIRAEMDANSAAQVAAESELAKIRQRSIGIESRIEIKEKEIELLETRADAAGKAKQDSERGELEARRKAEEGKLEILKKLLDVSSALTEKAERTIAAAKAGNDLCEREMELASRRFEWNTFVAAPATGGDAAKRSVELRKGVREAEKRVLDAMKERASKRAEVAERDAELADKLSQAFNAWNQAGGN